MIIRLCSAVRDPVPVDPVNDWVDYLGAFSGIIGAVLAALAIFLALHQSASARRDLIQERRLEFELRLLAEIRDQMSTTGLAHLSGYVGALVPNPSDETDLPLLRASIGVKAGPQGQAAKKALVGGEREGSSEVQSRLLSQAAQEVDDAIQRRLESR
ncbi:hypothetical protein [Nocardioides marmotae]|uniref:hypothetical protein n=1 Tax=Nocardioides marmotae TaxID=2663857 RepID=UPI0012B607A8|nr:hypothetical protein [Nocardioides marmotae]MBC9733555.1 hypothetical protein [Nocardioides marmotae]MTB84661.1 hypothetical protein [Nocardioides marmotae]